MCVSCDCELASKTVSTALAFGFLQSSVVGSQAVSKWPLLLMHLIKPSQAKYLLYSLAVPIAYSRVARYKKATGFEVGMEVAH